MPRTLVFSTLVCALTLSYPGTAHAQSQTQALGILLGLGELGVDWEVSNRLAIRPAVSFVTSASASAGSQRSSWTGTAILSGICYLRQWDALRLYASPRFAHTLNRVNGSGGGSATQTLLSGSLGTQVALAPRFSVFAETGVSFNHLYNVDGNSHTWANRSAFGGILFF